MFTQSPKTQTSSTAATLSAARNGRLAGLFAATATVLLLAGMTPASAHSFEACSTICFNAGGSVQACANKCTNHKHGGSGVQPLDNLDFKAKGRPGYEKFGTNFSKFKASRRRQ